MFDSRVISETGLCSFSGDDRISEWQHLLDRGKVGIFTVMDSRVDVAAKMPWICGNG